MEDLTIRRGEDRLGLTASRVRGRAGEALLEVARVAVAEPGEECAIFLTPDDLRRVARWALDRVAEADPPMGHDTLPARLRARADHAPHSDVGTLLAAAARLERLDLERKTSDFDRLLPGEQDRPPRWADDGPRWATDGACAGCGALPATEHADRCPVYLDLARRNAAAETAADGFRRWVVPLHFDALPEPGSYVRCGPAGAVWILREWCELDGREAMVGLEPVDPHDVPPDAACPELHLPVRQAVTA